jgi:hypothetical protein
MRSEMSVALLGGLALLAGCESIPENKASQLNTGDSQEMVLKVMGPPAHSEINEHVEAWQYCVSDAEARASSHTLIWFRSGHVTGVESHRSNIWDCNAKNQPVIHWDSAPR